MIYCRYNFCLHWKTVREVCLLQTRPHLLFVKKGVDPDRLVERVCVCVFVEIRVGLQTKNLHPDFLDFKFPL